MAKMVLPVCGVLLVLAGAWGGIVKQDIVASTILTGYNKDVAPDVVDVKIGLEILRIRGLDVSHNTLSMETWFLMEWKDERLAWQDTPLNGLAEKIHVPASRLWIPDITLYNSVGGYSNFNTDIRVAVQSNGQVLFVPPITFNSACAVDEYYSSGENVTCALKFGSWVYDGNHLDLHSRNDAADVSSMEPNFSDWEYVTSSVKRNVLQYACCPEPYIDITYEMVLKNQGDD